MIATVNVRLYYQPHCQECMKQVETTISSAIRDVSVAGVSMVAANKCEHDALATLQLTGPKKATPTPPRRATGQAEGALPGQAVLIELPQSATEVNGFDAPRRT